MTKFSPELIQQTIKCFAEEYEHHINEDTASEYLDSMARLYLAFSKVSAKTSDLE
jgi:hypothetical protein